MAPCLLTDRDEISNLYRGPFIDASYQILVHLTKRIRRRRVKCEKLTGRRSQSDGRCSHGLSPGELKRTKGQTMIYKALRRKLKIEQHEPH